MIMGHEGAGTVVVVGSNVTVAKPGDRIIASLFPACGNCFHCVRAESHLCDRRADIAGQAAGQRADGAPIYSQAGLGTYAELMTIHEFAAIKIETDLPAQQLALLGCGFTTGCGGALWTAGVTPGSTVAVFGCGGVGQAAIQGAKLAGAANIFAVDPVKLKRDMAGTLGATTLIDPADCDPVEQILSATRGRGVDYSFEITGLPRPTEQAIASTRRHGTTVCIGIPTGGPLSITLPSIMDEKTIKTSLFGSAQVRHHIPMLIALVEAGRLDLEVMISRVFKLEEINDAFEAMLAGQVIRSVVV
jgi:S-(hydroxymethyl)glutathione dehydrogenase/alcohol dehydrogenase